MSEPLYTLEEAKQYLRLRIDKGANCPCCTQYVRRWKQSINSSIANSLIRLYWLGKQRTDEWVHVPSEIKPKNGGMFSIAQMWDLIEPKLNDDTSKRSSGIWRLTTKGKQFVNNEITIPKYAYIYDNKLSKLEGKECSVKDALGNKFDYEELMSA